MTPDEVVESYKLQDLAHELDEANALAERCSSENVALRLQLATERALNKQLRGTLDSIRVFTRLQHNSLACAMRAIREMTNVE